MNIIEKLQLVAPEIKKIIASATKTPDGKKAAGDKVLALLLANDLAYKELGSFFAGAYTHLNCLCPYKGSWGATTLCHMICGRNNGH